MKVLIACEFSGRVREELTKNGVNATSCDLLPSEIPGKHIIGDVESVIQDSWDAVVAFPPCTYICVSGARFWGGREELQYKALCFAVMLLDRACYTAVEQPVGKLSSFYRPPDQYVHPYWFGEKEQKKTGLWLKNLPPLIATRIMVERNQSVHRMAGGKERSKNRSRISMGIAIAMGKQWCEYLV